MTRDDTTRDDLSQETVEELNAKAPDPTQSGSDAIQAEPALDPDPVGEPNPNLPARGAGATDPEIERRLEQKAEEDRRRRREAEREAARRRESGT